MKPWPRRRSEDRALAAFDEAVNLPRYGFTEALWHWRYEAMVAGLVFAAGVVLMQLGRTAMISVAVAGLSAASPVAAWPAARRWLRDRWWWFVTPHRVRTACAQAHIHSRRGRLPIVTHTTITPSGERVRLWCRAGTAPEDLVSARPLLRAACWAKDVRVYRHERHAHLVTVEVIRR